MLQKGGEQLKPRKLELGNKNIVGSRVTEARKALGIQPDDFAVLSFGGSLGAMKINQEMQIAV